MLHLCRGSAAASLVWISAGAKLVVTTVLNPGRTYPQRSSVTSGGTPRSHQAGTRQISAIIQRCRTQTGVNPARDVICLKFTLRRFHAASLAGGSGTVAR
eukprot:2777803-Rhodomonas_salina.1